MRRLLALLGMVSAPLGVAFGGTLPAPYSDEHANKIYNLLFCDDAELFRGLAGGPLDVLFDKNADSLAVARIASNTGEESRVRMLAYNWLRQHGQMVPPKILLGVIVEMPQDGGLDTLAAYVDGRVRYINQSGRMAVVETAPAVAAEKAKALLEASQKAVAVIGPWDKPRLPPPVLGKVRLTFLVSDGLYFGEGKIEVMERDPIGGPVLENATALLLALTSAAQN